MVDRGHWCGRVNKKRRCRECRDYHVAADGIKTPSGYWFCTISHAVSYARSAADKKRAKDRAKAEKAGRASVRARKEAMETIPQATKKAQQATNRYIRARDAGKPCICCGEITAQKYGGTMEAGHYRSRGASAHLRFNVLNIHLQTARCNRFLSGNAVNYRIGLIERIGLERVEELENDNEPRTFNLEYLRRIKTIFNKRARWYEKRMEAV